jgi:hypothetical protein
MATHAQVRPDTKAVTKPEPLTSEVNIPIPDTMAFSPLLEYEQINRLAHQLWQERGRPEGSPDVDWYEAERQLRLNVKDLDLGLHEPENL